MACRPCRPPRHERLGALGAVAQSRPSGTLAHQPDAVPSAESQRGAARAFADGPSSARRPRPQADPIRSFARQCRQGRGSGLGGCRAQYRKHEDHHVCGGGPHCALHSFSRSAKARESDSNRVWARARLRSDTSPISRAKDRLEDTRGVSYRRLKTLVFHPSQDIGDITTRHAKRLGAKSLPAILLAVSARLRAQFESDLFSFVLFDGDFAEELISLGRHDARQRADEVISFFNA